ncbi:MAG: septum formation family protein [Nakamurella sp.]
MLNSWPSLQEWRGRGLGRPRVWADRGGDVVDGHRRSRSAASVFIVAGLLGALSGCSWVSGMFADDGPPQESVSVFDVSVGQCFAGQQKPETELATLEALPCTEPHRQEAYAIVEYQPPTGVEGDAFPGNAALASWADAACAEQFADYVGISYLDSSLFFTYLLPSALGWEQSKDRSVICFVTSTGDLLTSSVKAARV